MRLLWALGGWLVGTHAFRLRGQERLPTGLATGLILFVTPANLLSAAVLVARALSGSAYRTLCGIAGCQ